MIDASRSFRRTVPSPPGVSGGGVPYLRVVDDDIYTDWESVYRDNIDRLYRLMYARVGNRPDAEDLTSEVFSTALPPMRLSSSKGEVRAYLLVTAKTVLASHWRRRLGQPVTTIDLTPTFAISANHPGLSRPATRQHGRARFWADCLSGTGASSNCGSWRRARSRRPRKPCTSVSATRRCSSTAPCGWPRTSPWSWNYDQSQTVGLHRRDCCRPAPEAVSS